MTTAQWTLVVEIISAFGVIGSLIYLAIQIRQSSLQTTAENLQKVLDRWVTAQDCFMRRYGN